MIVLAQADKAQLDLHADLLPQDLVHFLLDHILVSKGAAARHQLQLDDFLLGLGGVLGFVCGTLPRIRGGIGVLLLGAARENGQQHQKRQGQCQQLLHCLFSFSSLFLRDDPVDPQISAFHRADGQAAHKVFLEEGEHDQHGAGSQNGHGHPNRFTGEGGIHIAHDGSDMEVPLKLLQI